MSSPGADELLDAARREAPEPEVMQRSLEALTAGTVEPIGVEGPSLTPPRRSAWPWVVVGVFLAAALSWVGLRQQAPVEPPPAPPPISATPPPPASEPQPPVVAEPVPAPGPAPSLTPVAPLVVPAPTVRPARPPAEPEDSLARELALLDRVRTELASDARLSLRSLDQHRREFPNGALQLEASLLRVEALLKADRRAEATRLAEKLQREDREGLVKERLERLLRAPER